MNMSTRYRRPAGRTFYMTVLTLCLLAALSSVNRRRGNVEAPRQLFGSSLVTQDQQCRLVHKSPSQCAFVQANCPDEEAGLISYLQLYYCSLSHAQPLAFAILVIWIGILFSTIGIAASDFLCINLSTIASILGMSESLAGVTFLAFGNGSPDVFSTFAAMKSHSGSLAVGELIGAASFITAVVAGAMALVRPFKVARKSFVREVGFFVVAACFSMVFLADGTLQVWECASMVGFYLFYVVFVVFWHWWRMRKRRRRLRETAARLHHHIPRMQELDIQEEEHDEEAPPNETTGLLQVVSDEEFAGLEDDITSAWKDPDGFDEEEQRERHLADLRSNMRVSWPARGERRNTITPIRPSLVGALEFRSVLHSLEKRSTHTSSIHLRRYSDDPSAVFGQVDGHASEPAPTRSVSQRQGDWNAPRSPFDVSRRGRAVSASDAVSFGRWRGAVLGEDAASEPALRPPSPLPERELEASVVPEQPIPVLGSPRLFLSPAASSQASKDHSPSPPRPKSPDRLAPPGASFHRPDYHEQYHDRSGTPNLPPNVSPMPDIPRISLPHSDSFTSSPSSAFPTYTDTPIHVTPASSRPPSIRLPPSSLLPESSHHLTYPEEGFENDEGEQWTFAWWPYKHLPPPQEISRTLFPTIYHWRRKSTWNKLLEIVTVPSMFLFIVTLPVVETEAKEEPADAISGLLTPRDGPQARPAALPTLPLDSPGCTVQQYPSDPPPHPHKQASLQANPGLHIGPSGSNSSSLKPWNRWLVCLQLFTAPLFTVIITWANLDESHNLKSLFWLISCSLLFSLVCLFVLLAATTPDHPPKYRSLLCFLGFAVAIAWISTIANEVVGVLKAFGVILGISDAILGLTIFAVGNSLGDLVADITFAKVGFPVMALSACFGGPMLNILLGIGVSGLYITIRHGAKAHDKHPHRPIKYKPYEIEVSTTLLISGVTLLVTLVGLLIVVPLNGWKMDRKIGWGLICLWSFSTIGNVIVEVLGLGGDIAVS